MLQNCSSDSMLEEATLEVKAAADAKVKASAEVKAATAEVEPEIATDLRG